VELGAAVLVALGSFALMEPITAATHRLVMHGPGIVLHRSHHRRVRPGESPRRWEANDAFPVIFASIVMLGFAIGFNVAGFEVLVPMGIGVTLYGAAYALVHDVYIHGRLGWFGQRRVPGFERLAAAHRVHHERNGAPYGMLVPVLSRSIKPASGSRPSHEPLDA
jgi:beta-carotene 3-hydroxylase